ncbi:MAG TPA: branched-chain amino acid ABC transporter permease [Methylomirabilota bacterium]|jgi:branched-chain amino acid transport system permease protein|nr:branched-chain amino acid ABC transporter permease [Methylomirabilota bacterium]
MTRRRLLAVGAFVAAAGIVPLLLDDFLVSLALSCLMYVALATSWAMFSGATRYVSLGTSAFFGLGAYASAWSLAALPWPIVVMGGSLIAAAFAAVAGGAILHLRGTYFAVLTFGMSELVRHAITYGEKQYAGTVGRVLTAAPASLTVYYTLLAVTAAALVTAVLVRSSRFGLALAGIGADEQRAQTLGVPTRWVKVGGFALSAAFAGAAGATMAVRWTYVDPAAVFNPFIGLQTVLMAIVGGAMSLAGPVLAAIVFSLLTEFLRLRFPYVYLLVLGTLLIVAVLYLPRGLAGLWSGHASSGLPGEARRA